ncbi:MAG: allantoinase [Desulfurococcales archaeon ex4484_42]|nr:MAG: allantoinase [Desulfurococcales archaeon ex4484_42]
MGDLLIRNGLVVLPYGVFKLDILIRDGVITALGKGLSASGVDVINASGKYVFPGIVDEHVHMREPGLTHKDNFTNGTMAAAAGGVTTVLEMPNTLPPVDNGKVLTNKAKLLEPKAYVDFGLYGVIHDSNIHEFEDLVSAGAIGFKIFMGPTTGNIPPPDDGSLYEAMLKSAKLGVPLAFHAENYALVKYFTEKVRRSGRTDLEVHNDSRPPICEEEAIQKLILYSRKTGGKAHIVHMSAGGGVRLLRVARGEGINVTGETNPHYLLLTKDDYRRYGVLIKVNPPIRGKEDQEELWRGVLDGTITAIGSDHAPHSASEKSGDVWSAASGFIGVQTLFPLMLDQALRGKLPLTYIPKLMSENPARLFSLYPKKGTIMVGSDGDLVIVDPNAKTVIKKEDIYAKYPLTPFIGRKLKGKIIYTILRGEVIAKEGKVIGKPRGRWLRPIKG